MPSSTDTDIISARFHRGIDLFFFIGTPPYITLSDSIIPQRRQKFNRYFIKDNKKAAYIGGRSSIKREMALEVQL
jgi:hypothetical protein